MTRFEAQAPMILAIIQLENQVKVLAQIVDCSEDAIKMGSRVKAVFRKVTSGGDSDTIQYGYKFAIDGQ
uniref:Putative nucleic acid binding protein n=1 Tax=uncultured marine thaumarchaeote KM3_74_C10 TaxID=1456270 RepID=A0A075HJD1_9ARCH|nr:putative nucleic acid binding protein [uncultured marine thaumarchaeote KM3_74_C10]